MKFYNLIKLICFAAILLTSNSYAAQSCDGFQIIIENKTPRFLAVTNIELDGATIQPTDKVKIDQNSKIVLTITNPKKDIMHGNIIFMSETAPYSMPMQLFIKFTLKNKSLVCEHTDDEMDYNYLIGTRNVGGVTYTLSKGKG